MSLTPRVLKDLAIRSLHHTERLARSHLPSKRLFFPDLGKRSVGNRAGSCLIAYVPDFIRHLYNLSDIHPCTWNADSLSALMDREVNRFSSHTHFWESAEIVRQCISRRYVVDYVCGRHPHLVPDPGKYDIIIDEWNSLATWRQLNSRCRTLFYATGAHWLFHNMGEIQRHAWLFGHHGAALSPQRTLPALTGPETADLVTVFGNATIRATFGVFKTKTRKLWISAVDDNIPLAPKNWDRVRKRFLYLNGHGWVHKGFDLVLDAFLNEPDMELVACGSGCHMTDPNVQKVYAGELAKVTNIKLMGWIDPRSPAFHELAASCVAFVNVSASEGASGAAVQCMHHGLLPVVTDTVGIEMPIPFPVVTGQNRQELVDAIRRHCRAMSTTSSENLEQHRKVIWEFARKHHTRHAYSESLGIVLDELCSCKASRPVHLR